MKTMKSLNQSGLLIISLFVFSLLSSCKKDNVNPDYVGTWVATGTINLSNMTMDYKDVITFSTSSFEDIGKVKNPVTSAWLDFVGLKGSMTVNGNVMDITLTDAGITTFDAVTGLPTGTLVYYKDNQSEFSTILTQSGMKKTFQSEYSISGNNLTLKTDLNNDGDYTDANETTVYTKQ